jgi:hypothetical protein
MRSLQELDINTVVLNDLQAEFGMAPAAEESQMQNAAQLLFLSCLHADVEVGSQVSLVTMSCSSPRTAAPLPCFPVDIKDSLKRSEVF